MMKVLGVCDNHDSGACLFIENELVTAVSEERLSRKKMTRGFPYLSIKNILDTHKLSIKDIDAIVVASKMTPTFLFRLFDKFYSKIHESPQFSYFLQFYVIYQVLAHSSYVIKSIDSFLSKLIIKMRLGVIKKKVCIIDHHTAHAASAYYTSGLEKALIITIDGMGDGLTVTVSTGEGNNLRRIFSQNGFCAVRNYYSRFTECLGFKPACHEGKVVGLAAYGNYSTTLNHMKHILHFKKEGFNYLGYLLPPSKQKFFHKLKKCSKEDVSAGVQKNLEEEVCKFVAYWVKKIGIKDIVLAGGLFANVKLNQRIHELSDIKSVYIFPHMGDGGLCVGAALAYLKPKSFLIKNLFLGPKYSDTELYNELKRNNLDFKYYKNIEREIAKLLAKGKTVARFDKNMEFGPRALGNRSILYQPTDKSVNKWLNKKLKRSEFMPFAPATLTEYSEKCYKNLKGCEYAAKFMTITFECTDWMKKTCPGVIHVDNTARPQIVSKENSPKFYKIIKEYYNITGIPVVINTSFNIHEEPIVCNPSDAIHAFRLGHLDYLAMGNYLIKNRTEQA